MSQLTVGEIKKLLEGIPDDQPAFFRRIAPICGNIEEVGKVAISTYSTFGQVLPCVIFEPMSDEDEEQ